MVKLGVRTWFLRTENGTSMVLHQPSWDCPRFILLVKALTNHVKNGWPIFDICLNDIRGTSSFQHSWYLSSFSEKNKKATKFDKHCWIQPKSKPRLTIIHHHSAPLCDKHSSNTNCFHCGSPRWPWPHPPASVRPLGKCARTARSRCSPKATPGCSAGCRHGRWNEDTMFYNLHALFPGRWNSYFQETTGVLSQQNGWSDYQNWKLVLNAQMQRRDEERLNMTCKNDWEKKNFRNGTGPKSIQNTQVCHVKWLWPVRLSSFCPTSWLIITFQHLANINNSS